MFPPVIRNWFYPNYICDNKVFNKIPVEELIGSWASTSNSASYYEEILILDESTYKQIVVLGNYKYTSPHYSWYLEQNEMAGTFLHFDHLRYCKGTSNMCQYEEGGGRDWLFYDSCNDKVIKMREKGILLLLNIERTELSRMYSSENGLVLKIMKTDSDNPAVYFVKQKDN